MPRPQDATALWLRETPPLRLRNEIGDQEFLPAHTTPVPVSTCFLQCWSASHGVALQPPRGGQLRDRAALSQAPLMGGLALNLRRDPPARRHIRDRVPARRARQD